MNFIESTLSQLLEMSTALCTCGHKDSSDPEDHKAFCKALKKFKGYDKITEGMMKKALEAKVEKRCKCDGGASLDPDDHEDVCPAKALLNDPGSDSDIDKADYDRNDR